MIRADLKHWAGRRAVKGPLEVDYPDFARQASKKLGKEGLIAVPNARGPDNPLGAEYRFEELSELAKNQSTIFYLPDDRSAFYDGRYKLWIVKTQEVNYKDKEGIITYLVFGLPFGENLKEDTPPAEINTPILLNAPSCTCHLELSLLSDNVYGIIVHASTAAVRPGANKRAREFYEKYSESDYSYSVGAIAVSSGHRLSSIASSYTIFSPQEKFPQSSKEFYSWLNNSIRYTEIEDTHKGTAIRETVFRHLPRMLQGVLSGERKSIFH